MATTTNYSWTTPDDTDLVKDGAAAIRTLGSSVDTTTKALNPSTTLGDVEYRSSTANTNTRLGIGTTGQVLTVSGGVPAWVTPSAGSLTLISTTTLSGTSTTITVAANSYKQLFVLTYGITAAVSHNPFIQINSITGASDYMENRVGCDDGTAFGPGGAKRNGIYLNFPGSYGYGTTATNYSVTTFFNPNDTLNKYLHHQGFFKPTNFLTRDGDCVVAASAVISSLVFKSDQSITAGTFELYGVN
jgi:hypothetical protein